MDQEGSEDRTEIKNGREDEMKDGWGQMEATDRGQEESRRKREEKEKSGGRNTERELNWKQSKVKKKRRRRNGKTQKRRGQRETRKSMRSAWSPLYLHLSYQSPPSSLQSQLHPHHVPKPVDNILLN